MALLLLALAACANSTDDDGPPGDPDGGAANGGTANGGAPETDACSDGCPADGSPAMRDGCTCPATGARMRIDLLGDFFAWPWPHSLRLTEDGTLDLADLPISPESAFLADNLPVIAGATHGFGTTAAILLSFDAPLAPDSVERDAAASLEADAPVWLANVDADSPDYGERIPITCRYRDGATDYHPAHFLSCLPVPGFPLRPDTLHALVLTDQIEAADGEPARASDRFTGFREELATGDMIGVVARSYEPLFELAEAEGLTDSVVGGTVFRTQDPVAPMRAIAEQIAASDPPDLDGDLVLSTETATDSAETGNFTALEGVYEAPIFQAGETPYAMAGGEIRFDADGAPIVASYMKLRVVMSIPDGEAPADGWPVALYHHGTGGDAGSFIRSGHAYHLAAAGVAMVGIDAPVHGQRRPADADPTFLFFNIQNVLALRDNIRQGAADLMVLKRFAEGLDVAAGESPTGAALSFDADRLFYMGHSQGGLTGPLMLAVTEGVRGAMLSGAGGSIVTSIVHKKTPVDLLMAARNLIKVPMGEPLDAFHPILSIVQTFTEPADTSNFVPYFHRWPGRPGGGLDVWATQGMLDEDVPPPIVDAFVAAAGLAPISPVAELPEALSLRGIEPIDGPVSANVTGADGEPHTGVFSQYPDGGHFVASRDPAVEAQLTHWFETLVSGHGELIDP